MVHESVFPRSKVLKHECKTLDPPGSTKIMHCLFSFASILSIGNCWENCFGLGVLFSFCTLHGDTFSIQMAMGHMVEQTLNSGVSIPAKSLVEHAKLKTLYMTCMSSSIAGQQRTRGKIT